MARKREIEDEDGVMSMDISGVPPRKGVKTDGTASPMARKEELDEMGEFEDQFEDEMEDDEDEGEVVIAPDSDDDEAMNVDVQQDEDEAAEDFKVYLPGQALEADEELVADHTTYEMLHTLSVEWPCLSFDVLRDNLGQNRSAFPMTTYVVSGSQADKAKDNKLYVMKLSQMSRTKQYDDDEVEDDDDDVDEDPILENKIIPHQGGVNRIRVMPHVESHIVASWADTGKVHIYDLTEHVRSLDVPGLVPPRNPAPIYTVQNHGKTEGFAMDWSSLNVGSLLTGDVNGRIFLTTRTPTAFQTDAQPFKGHTSSVEDLQWAPNQPTVFASASADQTIKIWDARTKDGAQLSVHAHDSDVNVISWHPTSHYLLASGSDSGVFSIWDLRNWTKPEPPTPAATFKWHQGAITSLEWKPHESSVIAVAGEDDQVTIWDFALERDAEEEATMTTGVHGEKVEVPPQLLFIHQGQKHVKEVHWHKQIPGVVISTAYDGLNIFKTINS